MSQWDINKLKPLGNPNVDVVKDDTGMIPKKHHHEQLQLLRTLKGVTNTVKHMGDKDLLKLLKVVSDEVDKRSK